MDFKTSELLKKYWEAETSLQEEQELKELLISSENADLKEQKALFVHFEATKANELDATFDESLIAKIEAMEQKKGTKVISLKGYFSEYARIAAAVVILLVSGMFYYQREQRVMVIDTFEDPKLAYTELKKQLLIVSQYLNMGKATVSELSNLGRIPSELGSFSKLGQASEGLQMLKEMNIENN